MLFKARSHNSYTSTVFIKSIAYAVVEPVLRSHRSNHDPLPVNEIKYCNAIDLPLFAVVKSDFLTNTCENQVVLTTI
ncbi:MAG: hypothetical protein RMY28_027260 [Nostoc sp. ChiSLP01]|nr:hypothetical protein [Nostoc sp. CmiSLP01]MDZ8282356.1 hypothetical protein [Nostoc sp. ChiSLP01]